MSINGCDISGWQPGQVNFGDMGFAYVKATQGLYKVNANHDAQVAQARSLGLVVGHYHFPAWGDPVAEARAFVAASGWVPGEFMVLDIENSPQTPWPADPVTWCVAFENEVARLLGIWCMDYAGPNVRAGWNWAPLAALGGGLIDPEYNPVGPSSSAPWANVAMWQNADTNITGGDSDVFYGDRNALIAYGTPGAVTQSGTITPITEENPLATFSDQDKADLFNALARIDQFRVTPPPEFIEAVAKAVATRPVPYYDPATGKDTGHGTTLATVLGYNDFQHTLTRNAVPAAVWNQPIGPSNAAGVLNNIDQKPGITSPLAALSATDLANLAKAVNDETDARARQRLAQ